jgi:hypothetical protein
MLQQSSIAEASATKFCKLYDQGSDFIYFFREVKVIFFCSHLHDYDARSSRIHSNYHSNSPPPFSTTHLSSPVLYHPPTRGANTHIGRFEESKARGWGHRGPTGADVDLRWLAVPTAGYQRCTRAQSVRCPRSALARSGRRSITIFHNRFISRKLDYNADLGSIPPKKSFMKF